VRTRWLLLLVLALGAVACSPGDGSGGELDGTTWVLRSYANGGTLEIVPDGLYADARFNGVRIDGFAGCNDYAGLARAGGRTLLISQVASTQKACADIQMTFESSFLTALHDSRFYGVRADVLTIYAKGGEAVLVFDAAPKNPLLGPWNVDSFATAPGSQAVPISGTELTAVFSITDVGGSSGCNTYAGVYGTNGMIVRISRLATTRRTCADEVMTQETAFLAALEGAAQIERRGEALVLRDRNGDILVAMTRPWAPEPSIPPLPSVPPLPSAQPTPTPKPTASPRASASARPEPTPTAAPTSEPTAAPTLPPPASSPPTSSCAVTSPSGAQLASIVYPASWSTVSDPPSAACRYFDPEPITMPSDGSSPDVAVTVRADVASYEAAVAAALDPANWAVVQTAETTVSGLQATLVEAESTAPDSGTPVGTNLYSYIIDYGDGGTVTIQTSGDAQDPAYAANTEAADLMAQASTFTPPPSTSRAGGVAEEGRISRAS
jgi:heat shock protein HslJ